MVDIYKLKAEHKLKSKLSNVNPNENIKETESKESENIDLEKMEMEKMELEKMELEKMEIEKIEKLKITVIRSLSKLLDSMPLKLSKGSMVY